MLSVIVPIYNEEKCISQFLEQVYPYFARTEFIFVDGGSIDNTNTLLKNFISKNCSNLEIDDECNKTENKKNTSNLKIIKSQKGRAIQMNAGANVAKNKNLLFLHADSIPPKDFDILANNALKKCKWGAFGIRFKTCDPLMLICSLISDTRVINRHVAFGDQGIFISKELFNEIGQFPEIPIMEDYQFSLNLINKGIYPKLLHKKIITSSRRFKSGNKLGIMWKMNRLRAAYRSGVDIEQISKMYTDIR